jgi:phosphate transport system substrate-binding protein
LVGIALAALMGVAACGDDGDTAVSGVSGEVTIDGSSTVAPLSTAAAELFQEQNPDADVIVGTSGTGGGFEKFCRGETDISDASRPIKDEESAACETGGISYQEFQVANDALTVVVSKDNDWIDCITVEQLKTIWDAGSTIDNWNQVDPSFPNEPLALFGPGADSGTFDYFTAEINGEEDQSRTDYEATEDDNVIVQGVSGSKGGMGYFGYTYYEENADTLKALKIDAGDGCVAPSTETAQDGTYTPLSRPLFIYVSGAGIAKPQVEAFVEYYLENAAQIAEEAQFVPLTAAQITEAQAALEELRGSASGAPSPAAT